MEWHLVKQRDSFTFTLPFYGFCSGDISDRRVLGCDVTSYSVVVEYSNTT